MPEFCFPTPVFCLQPEIRQIRSQVAAFIFAEDPHGQAHDRPEVQHMVFTAVVVAHVFDLGVTVVTGGDDILGPGGHDLVELDLAIGPPLFGKTALQGAATAAAAVVVNAAGDHVHEVLFTYYGFEDEAKLVGHLFAQGFPDDVAGILNRELDLQVLVPVRIDLEFALSDPLSVELDDAGEFKLVGDVEPAQSFQDRKVGVPSLGVDHHLAPQGVVDVIDELFHDVAPALFVG